MENCLYHGKAICTFDLKDESGIYYEDMVLAWKQAAADRLLTCQECGAHVYLAAGSLKEPYFAHYDLEDCEYGNGHESEELKKGKRLLYRMLKRSFPESTVQARYRMENGMYSTLYCTVENSGSIIVDYRLQNNSLDKFQLRNSFYQANQIIPLYVMGIRQENETKQINWYQSLLQTSMGYLAFLDVEQESLTLKKSFGYRIGKNRKFLYCNKTYELEELLLDSKGQMICDFRQECYKIEQLIKEEKKQYQRMQEKLLEIQELNQRLETKEKERLEAYREHEIEAATAPPSEILGLNPVLLEKCKRMIEEGNAHLVSKKYYDAIVRNSIS